MTQYLLRCPKTEGSKRLQGGNIRELGAEEDGGNASDPEVTPKREVKKENPAPVSKKDIAFFDRDAAVASTLKAHQLDGGTRLLSIP